jgi:hypothetical protein
MAKLVGKKIAWEASASPDVVSYNLYIVPSTEEITYDTASVNVVGTEYALPGEFTLNEGEYKAAVCAVDSAGNFSDLVEIQFPLDVVAPLAPTGLRIIG